MIRLDELPVTDIHLDSITGIHPIAELNPLMGIEDFSKFKEVVKYFGYTTVPIILYRGKIVDGRHRYRACKELGITSMACRVIPHKTKLTEIQENLIMAQEIRRHTTPTQKSCQGAMQYFSLRDSPERKSQQVVAKDTKTSLRLLKSAIYIYKNNRKYFDALHDGNSVLIGNNYTTRLDVVELHLKDLHKRELSNVEEPVNVEESFLEDEFIINGKRSLAANVMKEAYDKFNMTPKDLADMFYKISKNENNK